MKACPSCPLTLCLDWELILQNQTANEVSNDIALHPNTATGAKTEQHNRRSQGHLLITQTKEAQVKKGHKVRHPKEKGHKTAKQQQKQHKSSQGHSNQQKQETTERRQINSSQSFENPHAPHMRNAQLMLPDQSVWCPTTGKCCTECIREIEEKNDYLDCREHAIGFWVRSSANQKGVAPKYG